MTPEIYTFYTTFRNFLRQHHPIFFFTLLGVLLAIALLSLYQVLSITFVPGDDTGSTLTSFDQTTVNKIKNLHDSKDNVNSTLTLPTPRANPFLE